MGHSLLSERMALVLMGEVRAKRKGVGRGSLFAILKARDAKSFSRSCRSW
jgi:hypothetical protein